MKDLLSRREALKNLMLGAGSVLAARSVGAASGSALPHVTANDQMAIALSYHEDATTVDPKKFPSYRPGQICGNCVQSRGKVGDAWVPCNIFPGKLVAGPGWCQVYQVYVRP